MRGLLSGYRTAFRLYHKGMTISPSVHLESSAKMASPKKPLHLLTGYCWFLLPLPSLAPQLADQASATKH